MVAAAIVPDPGTQLPFTQITAPVGTLPSPTALPPEFKNAEEGTNSYNKPAPARTTVFWLPKISQAKPDPGRPIAVIRVVGRSDPFANLHKAGRGIGIEVAQLVVGIGPRLCASS